MGKIITIETKQDKNSKPYFAVFILNSGEREPIRWNFFSKKGKLFKQNDYILGYQGAALFRMGKEDQAVEYFNRCISMNPDGLQALWVTCMKAYIEGNIDVGLEAARQFELVNIVDPEPWYHFAGNYGLLGDRDGCVRALQRAVDGGFFNYPFMLKDSFLDSMREDDEFQKVLEEAREKHFAFRKKII